MADVTGPAAGKMETEGPERLRLDTPENCLRRLHRRDSSRLRRDHDSPSSYRTRPPRGRHRTLVPRADNHTMRLRRAGTGSRKEGRGDAAGALLGRLRGPVGPARPGPG